MIRSRFLLAAALTLVGLACKRGGGGPSSGSSASPTASASADSKEDEAKARRLVEALGRGDAPTAAADFDAKMKAALPVDKLGEIFPSLAKNLGPFRSIGAVRQEVQKGHHAVLLACTFEKGVVTARVVFGADHQVTGLHLVPAEPSDPNPESAPWQAPAYADPTKFKEREVKLPGTPSLPGTLAVPSGAGPFPGVVLVHGSGPNDADESIGGTKVFKDLAWGLASHGVAVLRYVKRTRFAPEGVVTVKEEVLDGARAGVELLGATPEVDKKRIFVVGHSQGAELAPRIAAETPAVAGIVLLAAPSRPLQDVVVDQFAYFATQHPGADAEAFLGQARAFKVAVEDPKLTPDADVLFPGVGPLKGAYFLSLRGYDPVKTTQGLKVPVLVLQGERDYQVTMRDLEGWKGGLGANPGVKIKTYPGLNHVFVGGTGASTPEEYARPSHVDAQVITDIAAFVTAGR